MTDEAAIGAIHDEKAPFFVMREFMKTMFGAEYIEKLVRRSKTEFAKGGVLNWEPSDANTIVDVSPMREPWVGQWGFRIRMVAKTGPREHDILINEFHVPQSTIPMFKTGDYSALN